MEQIDRIFINKINNKLDTEYPAMCGKRIIVRIMLSTYERFLNGDITSRNVEKETLVEIMEHYNLDGITYSEREIRRACRELLEEGFPIFTSSGEKGYFISNDAKYVDALRKENYNRAINLLKANKGYIKAIALISGQEIIDDIKENIILDIEKE